MRHTITFDSLEFEIVVIDTDIVLQNIHRDVIFSSGYTKVCEKLEKEWRQQGAFGKLRDYILEYEVESMIEYVEAHKEEGEVIENHVN